MLMIRPAPQHLSHCWQLLTHIPIAAEEDFFTRWTVKSLAKRFAIDFDIAYKLIKPIVADATDNQPLHPKWQQTQDADEGNKTKHACHLYVWGGGAAYKNRYFAVCALVLGVLQVATGLAGLVGCDGQLACSMHVAASTRWSVHFKSC